MRYFAATLAALLLLTVVPFGTTAREQDPVDDSIMIMASEGYTTDTADLLVSGIHTDGKDTVSTLDMKEGAKAAWSFQAKAAGLYTVSIRYLALKGTSNDIEAKLQVNGTHGEDDLQNLTLKRVWTDADKPGKDANGNELRPKQVETEIFNTAVARVKLKNEDAEYRLNAGENTLFLSCERESMAVLSITLTPVNHLLSYKEYISQYDNVPKAEAAVFEAESAAYKSSAALYAVCDRSSSDTSPNHYYLTKLNCIGGNNWRYAQQWIEWSFRIKEPGLYRLSMRLKQNYKHGQNSCRRIYIDGAVPYREMGEVSIPYSSKWQNYVVGGEENPCLVYLEAGEHTLRMENTIGTIGDVLVKTNELVQDLNDLYRSILVYIGNKPDTDRDYQLDLQIPGLKDTFQTLIEKIEKIKAGLLEVTGEKGENYAQFEDIQRQLTLFKANLSKIPKQFKLFQTNIRSLSEWLLTAQEQPVLLDQLAFTPADKAEHWSEQSFWGKFWYQIKSFVASFVVDYSTIAQGTDTGKNVTVWVGSTTTNAAGTAASGRDQALALQSIINSYFTPQSGIRVNLKLVDGNSLIPAVATGNGPDVSLFMASKSVMDYGFRSALYDLTDFPDYNDAIKVFHKESTVPFTYNGSAYALPDSYAFSLMFYRKDILDKLKLELPETWDDVFRILPELNNNYLSFGLPSLSVDSIEIFTTMLYQKGGSAYDVGGTKSRFSSAQGIEAFEQWGDFYTKYNVPQKLDLLTYFRTGQTPLIIAPYTFYNNLAAGAPEIEGLWGATCVPGTKQSGGSVNHTAMSSSTGTVIFSNAENPEAAWEFLKWWTGEEAQYQYGIEVETSLGPAGRIATATVGALRKLPWTREAATVIEQQLLDSRALPEVPGGYMSTRYIPTAMRLVVNNNIYPRDALIDYSRLIDEEIATKRQEFHLN